MNLEQLDLALKVETKQEAANKAEGDYDTLPIVPDSSTLDALRHEHGSLLELVNNADGAVVSKQDRYKSVPFHSHDWLELAYMYSGSCTITFENSAVTLHKGDCILINSYVSHSNSCCGEDDILINFLISRKYLNANFFNRFSDASYISSYFISTLQNDHRVNDFILFKSACSRRLPIFINEYLIEFYNKGIYSKDFLDSYITLIFLELADIYKSQSREETKANDIIYILRYLEENYNSCTLDSTAKFFHMNPNYLSGYIKKNTGKNFKQLIQEQRLAQASRLLLNTNLSITAIANEVGYDNVTFFYKKFRESFGCSPAEYRNI